MPIEVNSNLAALNSYRFGVVRVRRHNGVAESLGRYVRNLVQAARPWLRKAGVLVPPYFWLLCLLVSSLAEAQTLDFEIRGKTKLESFGLSGGGRSFTGQFTIRRFGQKWMIEHQWNGLVATEKIMSDGVDNFSLTENYSVQPPKGRAFDAHEMASLTVSNGMYFPQSAWGLIYAGQYPWGGSPHVRFLWTTFLFGELTNKLKLDDIPAPWAGAAQPEARGFQPQVEWCSTEPLFPSRVEFCASQVRWRNASQEIQTRAGPIGRAPFTNGFIGGRLQVNAWTYRTNDSRFVAFPQSAELERYYFPMRKAGSSENLGGKIAERMSVEITSIKLGAPWTEFPDIHSEVNVTDFRFRSAQLPWLYVNYRITNRVWLPTNDLVVQSSLPFFESNYASLRSRISREQIVLQDNISRRRYVIAGLILFGLLMPICLSIRLLRRPRREISGSNN